MRVLKYNRHVMQIFRGLTSPSPQPLALTVGNFDGVHVGHQALIQVLKTEAAQRQLATGAVIFEPHPREFFSPETAPPRLSSLREKLEQFERLGLDQVHICAFNERFAQMPAQAFARALHDQLQAKFVVIGDDFRFGRGRAGDIQLLQKMSPSYAARAMSSVLLDGVRVSSTVVRQALQAGQLQQARQYLGRHYSISGRVVRGAQVGRQLGFPTANILPPKRRPPLSGVFVVEVHIPHWGVLQGVANVGIRPTVNGAHQPMLEVHLFEFDQQLYGKPLRVVFLQKLRDEQKFANFEALRQQIVLDVTQAKNWFERHD